MTMQQFSSKGIIAVRCPAHVRDELKVVAARQGEAVSIVVRQLITSAVNRSKNGERILCGFEARG